MLVACVSVPDKTTLSKRTKIQQNLPWIYISMQLLHGKSTNMACACEAGNFFTDFFTDHVPKHAWTTFDPIFQKGMGEVLINCNDYFEFWLKNFAQNLRGLAPPPARSPTSVPGLLRWLRGDENCQDLHYFVHFKHGTEQHLKQIILKVRKAFYLILITSGIDLTKKYELAEYIRELM